MAVLIVEDNARLAASLLRGLREEGLDADSVASGQAALARLREPHLEAVILDLGLPDLDGEDVIIEARRSGVQIPILVLTARDAISSRVRALEEGADDYLIKPFSFEELLARLRALIRRARAPRWPQTSLSGLAQGPEGNDLIVRGRPVVLSPRERMLLELLWKRKGEVVSRLEILSEAFGYSFDPGTNLIDVHLTHLRKKLGKEVVRIETVRGVGFRLTETERMTRG